MTEITEQIIVYSENGDNIYPNSLKIDMDASQPNLPITFWYSQNGLTFEPVFSLGQNEIEHFIKVLKRFKS